MGQKIATEEDYWMCTQGIMPARMQSVQLTVKQKDGKKYLLKTDTATASVGDFVCKWMMLIMAAIAAIVTVAIVATGGAALGAIVVAGAIAGAAGAAVGSIAGALVCGQKAALIRTWTVEKNNLVIGGQKTLTTGSVMKCPIFGAEIRQAPNVKNWWQALLVGVGNFGTTVVEGALGGALIGTIGAVFAGAATIAVPTLGSIWANIAGSFTGIGLAVRGVFGANQASNDWATGRANTASDAAQSFGEGAIPEAGSIKRIATGQAQPTDALLLLYFLHLKTPVKEPQPKEEPAKEDEGKPKDEPDAQAPKPANEPEAVKPGEDGKAYEKGEGNAITPESFGIKTIADNPELLEVWNDTLRKLANSKFDNAYKRYLNNLEQGKHMNNEYLGDVWKYVRSSFKTNAEGLGFKIDGEIHHWNYNKETFPEQIANPRNITEPIGRDLHQEIHQTTTSDPSNIWKGPIKPEYQIDIDHSIYTPPKHNF